MNNTYTSVIRNRGQLTIPDKVRESHVWASPNSVVTIISDKSNEITIKPRDFGTEKEIDWNRLWKMIELSRSFKGKRGNLSKFIAEDRKRH